MVNGHAVSATLRRTCSLLLACSLPLAAGACASGWDGGKHYYKQWRPAWRGAHKEASFRVGQPGEQWSPLREDGLQVAWKRDAPAGAIQVRSQCEEHGDSSLVSFTDHLRIDFGEWKVQEQTAFELVGRAALRTRVAAELDGVPVSLELVVVKKNGCLFDLSYVSPPGGFEAGLPDFDEVVAGFDFPLRGGRG